MKLYEFRKSRSYKCRWLINELGIDCDSEEVHLLKGEHLDAEFQAINPAGKVPALVDGDLKLHEASAICIYLADKYPEKRLIPLAGSRERAVCDKWLFFMANEMECHLWLAERHTWFYPEEKRSAVAIEMAEADFMKAAAIVDRELEGKSYLVGDSFSIADISLCFLIRWANTRDLLGDFPKLLEYRERHILRPAFPKKLFENSKLKKMPAVDQSATL